MKRILYSCGAWILIMLIFPFDARNSVETLSLKLATYNLGRLGHPQSRHSAKELSKLLVRLDADLICFQELHDSEKGKRLLKRVIGLANRRGKNHYLFLCTPSQDGELLALAWRTPLRMMRNPTALSPSAPDSIRVFKAKPVQTLFDWKGTSFWVLNFHAFPRIQSQSSSGQEAEYLEIGGWIVSKEDTAAVVLGDFNRNAESMMPWVKFTSVYSQWFRAPILEGIALVQNLRDVFHVESTHDSLSTVTGRSPAARDQILINRTMYGWIPSPPVWGRDAGILFDPDDPAMSDHRPVWILLKKKLDLI